MSQFDKPLTGIRWAETWFGDTLQAIASRELGDATQWPLLANLNGLSPPYFNPPTVPAQSGYLRYGDLIKIPATTGFTTSTSNDVNEVFGIDIALVNGLLTDDGKGDFLSVEGVNNLTQALSNAINTPPNDLIYHPEYRDKAWSLIGNADGPTSGLLAAQYVDSLLKRDDRVQSVDSVMAQVSADTISVTAQITPVVGQSLTVSS